MTLINEFLDLGGAVYNVKAYGAVGDGVADDTQAFADTIAAASLRVGAAGETATGARGSVVYVPHGIYRITATLSLRSGVSIRGAGMRTSQVRFELSKSTDGLRWDQTFGDESPYQVGAFLEDIDIITKDRNTEGVSAQDLVVVRQWQSFAINRVRIHGASRYNLHLHNCMDVSAFHLSSHGAGVSCLYIDADSQPGATTTRWVSCYFQNSAAGPAVDVDGIGHTFDGCVFESAGDRSDNSTGVEGYGARVRWGTAVFIGPYFEANQNFDLVAGTEATENPFTAAQQTAVTVINPTLVYHDTKKIAGAGGVYFQRGTATILGGNYGTTPRPLVLSREMDHVFVAARMYGNEPEVEGGCIDQVPGTVLYEDRVTRQWKQTGAAGYCIGGGALIRKHLSAVADWTPGTVKKRRTVNTNVLVPGAQFGDTVVVSFNHIGMGFGAGASLFGSVAAPGNVAVTLINHRSSKLDLGAGTLRVDVWQH